jgi:NitT/TauT family transport system ATP-binding protein
VVSEQTADPRLVPSLSGNVVEFRNVTKTFDAGTPRAFTAIQDVNFTVQDRPDRGEFVAVLGPSGCGKSTVLRLIAGLRPQHPATAGEVRIADQPVSGPGADRGMVFQDYTSFDNRTVLDNVAFGLECRGVGAEDRRELARAWIGRVGLDMDADATKYPHQLSGGMRQRVAIARTLILSPRIILMDEPFGALDPGTRLRMQDLLIERVYILSSSPGTILRELAVPYPDRPAKEMQRSPEFLDLVFDIRDTIDKLESSTRAGDD